MVIADPTADPGALLRPDELAMKFVSGARSVPPALPSSRGRNLSITVRFTLYTSIHPPLGHNQPLSLPPLVANNHLCLLCVPPSGLSWRPFWFSLLPFSYEGWQQIEWKILQKLFQRDFKLPGDFDYTQYLRLKLLQARSHHALTFCTIMHKINAARRHTI